MVLNEFKKCMINTFNKIFTFSCKLNMTFFQGYDIYSIYRGSWPHNECEDLYECWAHVPIHKACWKIFLWISCAISTTSKKLDDFRMFVCVVASSLINTSESCTTLRVCLVVRRKWEERNRWERVWEERNKWEIELIW